MGDSSFVMYGHFLRHILSVIMSVMLLAGCRQPTQTTNNVARAVQAEGYIIAPRHFSFDIKSTGELLAFEEVEIKAPVAGNVMQVVFREGQYVEAGALLVELDSRIWQAQLTSLGARLVPAEADLTRKLTLLPLEGASQEETDMAKALVSDIMGQIEELKVRISLARIRAPFSGYTGMRNFSPGAWLMQGEVLTRLVQTHRLRLDFTLASRYAVEVSNGAAVEFVSKSNGQMGTAVIYSISPEIDPATRGLRVRAEVKNEERIFLPGDFVEVNLTTRGAEQVLMVPTEALISELNRQVVFLYRQGEAVRSSVQVGPRSSEMVQITDGLAPGDTLLVTGLMEIRDGSQVVLTGIKNGGDTP